MSILKKVKFTVKEIKRVVKAHDENGLLVGMDVIWCGLRYGASPKNYLMFDMRHATRKERKTYLNYRQNEAIMRKFNDPNETHLLQNKYAFASFLGDKYGRAFAKTSEMDFSDFSRVCGAGSKIVYKPLSGRQGRGIEVFDVCNDLPALFEHVKSLPEGIVEGWIEQHPTMSTLYPDAVNPLRVQTFFIDDQVKIVGATLTLGNGTRYANASTHTSIFALIDTSTGIVYTDGCDYDDHYFYEHPVTHTQIKGFQIPCWDEVVSLVTETAKTLPKIRHIGWDIAITPNGPLIIEGNNQPGYVALQYPVLTKKHEGIWPIYKKYM